ncbi:hypothetical protein HaLaN_19658 [Haematococcus lacustris]|uniref:Uncharacterized protein n=1 Tax=Haematococcus lacustris TaxID=44745 RepID=A0A699ZRB9_HAELA|nr:hypothetical protein HaLaN_19658 [Haematococcus lacustris]
MTTSPRTRPLFSHNVLGPPIIHYITRAVYQGRKVLAARSACSASWHVCQAGMLTRSYVFRRFSGRRPLRRGMRL